MYLDLRFRSIAKSYFRRADGVLLLYDVTCEKSFLNVREWVDMIEVTHTTPLLEHYHSSLRKTLVALQNKVEVKFILLSVALISFDTFYHYKTPAGVKL